MSEFDINKSVFRDDLVPENSQTASVGTIARRFKNGRFANLFSDVVTWLTETTNTLTVNTSATLGFLTAGYLKSSAVGAVSAQTIPIPIGDGGTGLTTTPTVGQLLTGTAAGAYSLGRIPTGAVWMIHDNTATGNWTVIAPDGTLVTTTGTTTQGLQEAINFAQNNGYPLVVWGGGIQGASSGGNTRNRITCTSPITVPTANGANYLLLGADLLYTGNDARDFITFDSFDRLNWIFRGGQIIYEGTGSAVRFNPVNTNGESFIGGTTSYIEFDAIVVTTTLLAPDPTRGVGVRISAANGLILENTFRITEIQGGLVGLQVDIPATGQAFKLNKIDATIHNQNSASITVGTGATSLIFGNQWFVQTNPIGTGTAIGLVSYAQSELYTISNASGNIGVQLNTGAANNLVVQNYNVATTPISDGGSANTFITSNQGLSQGTPAGGPQGVGTINVTGGYYKSGVLITPTLTLKSGSGAADYTTTSATYVDVDATNLAYTVTIPTGWKLYVTAACEVKNSTLAAAMGLALFDTVGTGAVIAEELVDAAVAGDREHMGLTHVVTGDGAAHTIKLQWKASAATSTMGNSSATLSPRMTFILSPSQ